MDLSELVMVLMYTLTASHLQTTGTHLKATSDGFQFKNCGDDEDPAQPEACG